MKVLVALLAASFSAVVLSKQVTRIDSTAVLGQLEKNHKIFRANTKTFKDLLESLGNTYESVMAEYEERMLELEVQADLAEAAKNDPLADRLEAQNEDLRSLVEDYIVPHVALREVLKLISAQEDIVDAMFDKLKGGLESAIETEAEVVKNQFQKVAKPLPVVQPSQPVQPAPVVQPQPVAQPQPVPVAQPSYPVVQPVPVAQPSYPVVHSTQPVVQPSQPVAQPYRPVVQPRPIAQPYRRVVQPYRPIVKQYRPVAQQYRPVVQQYRPVAQSSWSHRQQYRPAYQRITQWPLKPVPKQTRYPRNVEQSPSAQDLDAILSNLLASFGRRA